MHMSEGGLNERVKSTSLCFCGGLRALSEGGLNKRTSPCSMENE